MKKLSWAAVFAASVLTLGACSSGDTSPASADNNANAANSAEEAAPELPGIGEKAEGDGVAMTVHGVELVNEIETDDGYAYDDEGFFEPRDGAEYVLVSTTVENTSDSSTMTACGGDIETRLLVDSRVYETLWDEQVRFPDNADCSSPELGPGLEERTTFVFEVPADSIPTEFEFTNRSVAMDSYSKISLDDYESKSERTSEGPNPSTTTEATEPTTATTTAATTQAPAPSAPALGAGCSEGQASQPGTASDGTTMVCTFTGQRYEWVRGPAGQGAGTASDGGSCVDGDMGGQDSQGRMMMCINGQWVYGP